MNNVKIFLIALVKFGTLAQAAPKICAGEDHQNGESYLLQVEEMATTTIQKGTTKSRIIL